MDIVITENKFLAGQAFAAVCVQHVLTAWYNFDKCRRHYAHDRFIFREARGALRVAEGKVVSMSDEFTPSTRQANESLRKLAKLDFEILIPYHGKPFVSGAKEALNEYLETLT